MDGGTFGRILEKALYEVEDGGEAAEHLQKSHEHVIPIFVKLQGGGGADKRRQGIFGN